MYTEIHKYQSDQFQYVVARTNKHSETKVKEDVERMNSMLSDEFKSQGIKYIFSVGTMAEFMKSVSKRQKERSRSDKRCSLSVETKSARTRAISGFYPLHKYSKYPQE